MISIEQFVETWGVTREETVKRLDMTKNRFGDLRRRRSNDFTVDELMAIVGNSGLRVRLNVEQALA